MSNTVVTANTDAAKLANTTEEAAWTRNMTDMIMDLRTSDFDIMKATDDLFAADGTINQARLLKYQQLINMRSNLISALSNIMKTLSDTARAVIQNFRA